VVNNIVLIGMPGTGKTTVGHDISDKTGLRYIDTDDLLKARCNSELKDFVAANGTEAFLELQRSVIAEISGNALVIATGGGVVLDETSMEHLRKLGKIVYLSTTFEVLESRLAPDRKLARNNGESFRDVFEKRQPLYRKYSDIIIDCSGKEVCMISEEICEYLGEVSI